MAIAQVQDGKIVPSASQASIAEATTKKSGSTMDKDAFLGLLVAQMKYQDPLEPTSNTEFVSQYAQFSSLEQMQNMSATLELSRASTLVGQVVSVNTTDSYGNATTLQGKVDFVTFENNKAYVSIGGSLYSMDAVYGVADQQYLDAYDLAYQFAVAMNKLPAFENLSLDDKENIDKLSKIYSGMSSYEKSFVAKDYADKLQKYQARVDELADNLVGDFTSAMDDLPEKDKLTADNKAAVDAANTLYNGLSEYAKKFVDDDYVKKLEEYTKRIEELTKESTTGEA